MKVEGYEKGWGKEGNWIVLVEQNPYISGEDLDWLDSNLEWWRLTGVNNIVVKNEQDAMLVYMRFK